MEQNNKKPKIEIRVGSDSDIPRIKEIFEILEELEIPYQERILSAHRTPEEMIRESNALKTNGYKVSIAAAGGSAHLQGMSASETVLPIIGFPIYSGTFKGKDAFYSIIQMPNEIPVGTIGIGMAKQSALNAAQIAYINDKNLRNQIRNYRGLDQLNNLDFSDSKVAIISPYNPDTKEVNAMTKILVDLNIKVSDYKVSVTDFIGIEKTTKELAENGYSAIIAPCKFDDENSNTYFPKLISEVTDIPTIGIPFAKGYAGHSDSVKEGVFEDMLYNTSADGMKNGSMVLAMGVNRGTNAALYAARICGTTNESIQDELSRRKNSIADIVRSKDKYIQEHGWRYFMR